MTLPNSAKTPSACEMKSTILIDAMSMLGLYEVKVFTATLIGVLQEKFTPEEFAAAVAEAITMTCDRGFAINKGGSL